MYFFLREWNHFVSQGIKVKTHCLNQCEVLLCGRLTFHTDLKTTLMQNICEYCQSRERKTQAGLCDDEIFAITHWTMTLVVSSVWVSVSLIVSVLWGRVNCVTLYVCWHGIRHTERLWVNSCHWGHTTRGRKRSANQKEWPFASFEIMVSFFSKPLNPFQMNNIAFLLWDNARIWLKL